MKELTQVLYQYRDEKYAEFQVKLTPGITLDKCIGVRVPNVRLVAKQYKNTAAAKDFLAELPHGTYDENMLHGALVAQTKDFSECLFEVERFLPFVDNWAVCDTLNPKVFQKHKAELLPKIKEWVRASGEYTVRFGVEILMNHFLDGDFKAEYLEIPLSVKREEYYVKMMVAWFFATALAKQWESTLPIIEQKRLAPWVHNKTIQKAIESYRITDEQKAFLRTLKV